VRTEEDTWKKRSVEKIGFQMKKIFKNVIIEAKKARAEK